MSASLFLKDPAAARYVAGGLAEVEDLFGSPLPALPAPEPGYVLIIDQTRGDASITACGARASTFREMLFVAQARSPAAFVAE